LDRVSILFVTNIINLKPGHTGTEGT